MLENTREIAELLPAEIFQNFVQYLEEINTLILEIASERQTSINDEVILEMELVFLIRFLQMNFLDSERNYLDLISFFQNLGGLSGFEYSGTYYNSNENLDLVDRQQKTSSYLDLKKRLNNSIRQLIRDANVTYLLDYKNDAEIIRRIINGNG